MEEIIASRTASLERTTGETQISLSVNLDGQGHYDVDTGNGFLNHMVGQLARHGLFDITLKARGDKTGSHHLVEDTAIMLGRAFGEAPGERRGIRRMGHAIVPLDETLVMVALDFSGRGYAVVETAMDDSVTLGDSPSIPGSEIKHFLERFALEGKINLHAQVLYGENSHHKAEALMKALARALRDAVEPDPRAPNQIPSTKGTLHS